MPLRLVLVLEAIWTILTLVLLLELVYSQFVLAVKLLRLFGAAFADEQALYLRDAALSRVILAVGGHLAALWALVF